MWPALSYALLCKRVREWPEFTERAVLEAQNVGVLVEIANSVYRSALFIHEFEQLAFIVHLSLSLSRFPFSMVLTSLWWPLLH